MAGRTREGGSEREEGEHCSQSGGVGGYDAAVPGRKKLPTPPPSCIFTGCLCHVYGVVPLASGVGSSAWTPCQASIPRRRCGIRSFEFSLNISTLLSSLSRRGHSAFLPPPSFRVRTDGRMDDDTTFGAAKSSPILWLFKRVLRQCIGRALTVSLGSKLKCWLTTTQLI